MTAETLRNRNRQHQAEDGERDGVSSAATAETRAFKRRNPELEQTIEILMAATAFFAHGSDPRNRRLLLRPARSSPGTGIFVYVAFDIDAYVGSAVDLEASASERTRFTETAIRQECASMRFVDRLGISGVRTFFGSVGDACDNALAETTIGQYKKECIRADFPFRRGPLHTLGDVEYITADYVAWFNQQRLIHRLAGPQNPEGA